MKKSLIFGTFMLSALVWAGAQQPGSAAGQPGSAPGQSGAQATTPGAGAGQSSSTMPSAGQSSTAPDAGTQATPQAGGSAAASNAPITEGCLGGSNPNYTLTDKAGTSYKLTLPANADGAKLAPHVGESVQVLGPVSGTSINVSQIGKGNGTCPGK